MVSDIANAMMLGLVIAIVGLGILIVGSIYASFMGWILERLGW